MRKNLDTSEVIGAKGKTVLDENPNKHFFRRVALDFEFLNPDPKKE